MPDGYGAPFAPIGICTTLGTKKTAALGGAIAGIGTAAAVYLYTGREGEHLSTGKRLIISLLAGSAVGGLTAFVAYFYCKGVETGVPLIMRKS
jgi:ABC-type enterobactin transport system permease subunit